MAKTKYPNIPRELIYFTNERSGWICVPFELVQLYGIENKISPFSFRSIVGKKRVYLDHHKDASLFMEVARRKGHSYRLRYKRARTPLRFVRGY